MRAGLKIGLYALVLALLALAVCHLQSPLRAALRPVLSATSDIAQIRQRQIPLLKQDLEKQGVHVGAPVFLRIFKETSSLELWVQATDRFQLFRSYPICNFSGDLGPKLKEGDRQSPEGIYRVSTSSLNPNSRFHLSFNLGFPNRYDQSHGRTGSFLMVHGDCLSIGCYAMTDPAIEEIYVLVEAALKAGQPYVPVHAFPFHLTKDRLNQETHHRWHQFWQELQPIYARFQADAQVPKVVVSEGRYRIDGLLTYHTP
ncbi:MAG: murein L,D-transpeptidase [Pelagimonas sp.]|jgi:murein L,D-transpeptidase YafK|nr:murein L,D-transpeptidase [Pelagimonas sp.]